MLETLLREGAVHRAAYVDPAVFALEQERIASQRTREVGGQLTGAHERRRRDVQHGAVAQRHGEHGVPHRPRRAPHEDQPRCSCYPMTRLSPRGLGQDLWSPESTK